MKRLQEDKEAALSSVISACIDHGFISCCAYHEGIYLDQDNHSDFQSIADQIKGSEHLEGYSDKDLLSLAEEAMSHAGAECQLCRNWNDS